MPTFVNEEQRALEREQEELNRVFRSEQETAKRDHEYRLNKLTYATKSRHDTIGRCVVAVAKLPALCIICIMVPIVIITGREVPEPIWEFLKV